MLIEYRKNKLRISVTDKFYIVRFIFCSARRSWGRGRCRGPVRTGRSGKDRVSMWAGSRETRGTLRQALKLRNCL